VRAAKTDLDRFLKEDLGRRGDVTTKRLFGDRTIDARARLYAREDVVAAGVAEAAAVFERLGAKVTQKAAEGTLVRAGGSLLAVRGILQAILTGERLALNILARMCGIATTTRRLASAVRAVNPRCVVAATRKTTPGFRSYEKRAVEIGGGDPHRFGLFDQVLIKDNHLAALGGDVELAVRRGRSGSSRLPVEIEVSRVRDAETAARAGADWILIDNVSPSLARRIAKAARAVRRDVKIEVSGGLTEKTVRHYAPFADRLSLGLLTHSARSADVTLDLVPKR
jgi:nicotinate-nucleotide pyrophosphorylase (carboxylating)